jgi:outer membrane protein
MTWKGRIIAATFAGLMLCCGGSRSAKADPANGAPTALSAPVPVWNPSQSGRRLNPPTVNVAPSAANKFENQTSILSLPKILTHQWDPTELMPPESVLSQNFIRTYDNTTARLTLKQVIYIALANNPAVAAIELSPISSTEVVRGALGVFDPDLTATADQIKTVQPATTALESGGDALSTKQYDWNFGLNKISAISNGTLSATFNNTRQISNNLTETINPYYNSTLAVSLAQPLLRNFGWKFATINVRLTESAQKQAQWTMAQNLLSFVQRVGNDYWNVVLSKENLQVAQESLKFNQDLVRQNAISVRVGTMAPLDLQEAQSSAATAAANVYTAEAALATARAVLRQDVMLNPSHSFLPQNIEPADSPNLVMKVDQDEMDALETGVLYSPTLGQMREAIRTALLQVKFQENQLLPQVNLQTQFANSGLAGNALCSSTFGVVSPNCFNPGLSGPPPLNGFQLPFSGGYSTVLNKLFNFGYYNYAFIFNYERPLSNAAARSALAQARVGYEQIRLQYRAAIAQMVEQIESALANIHADIKRVEATKSATYYARQALHDEEVRFRVGMATTHDLLQYENELVTAQGNEVQADIDLENAWLALQTAKGTLLSSFDIKFQVNNPDETPWYSVF